MRTFEEILEGDYHVILGNNRRDESIKLAVDKYIRELCPSSSELKATRNRICDAVYKCLEWDDGEIGGIAMLKLEHDIGKLPTHAKRWDGL